MTKLFRKRFFFVFLILVFLSGCPGINDGLRLFAQESQESAQAQKSSPDSENQTQADNPFGVTTDNTEDQKAVVSATATPDIEEIQPEDSVKKEMGRVEKLAWTIGKALLPTLAVMAFGAAVACPLAWIVVGSVVIGAATAGITTFAYEKRMNQFREEGKKKADDKIWRDVSIAAAVEGAMAPFSMLSAGFVKAVGPTTVKSIVTAAAKVGATQFVGGTISNLARGGVTNLWYNHYYNYDEEEKSLKNELDQLKSLKNPSADQEYRIVEIMQRLDSLEKEKYTKDNFLKDQKKTAVSAAISGVLGGAATQIASNQNWAKIASDKLFKSPKNSGMVARAVVSNPFAFVSGSANAVMQKREIDQEIEKCRRLQSEFPEGSPVHGYYEDKIGGLEKAREQINVMASGKNAMINNMAVQSAGLTVAVARARLWDLPHARREQIDKKMKEKMPEWQQAQKIKAKADALRSNPPRRENYSSREAYRQAIANHKQAVSSLDNQYKAAKVIAVDSESSLEGKALREQLAAQVDAEIDLRRRTDLAKSLGDEEYLKFKMEEIKKRSESEGQTMSDEEIRNLAVKEFKQEYEAAAKSSASKLAKMEEKLTLRKDKEELEGKIITDENGKKYVVLEDGAGNERYRRAIEEPKVTWYNKFFQKDPAERELREIAAAQRIADAGGAMVKPSEYRSSYVDMKVNELKAQGYTNDQVNAQMGSIVSEADSAMLNTFGGSWSSAVQAEMLSAGLSRAKYNNGEPPDLQGIYNTFHSTAQTKIIQEFQKELTNQAKAYTLTPIKNKITGGKNDTFFEKYMNTTLDKTFNEAVKKNSDKQVKKLFENVEKTTTEAVGEAVTEATYDYEGNLVEKEAED
jgi:hypothetical protein